RLSPSVTGFGTSISSWFSQTNSLIASASRASIASARSSNAELTATDRASAVRRVGCAAQALSDIMIAPASAMSAILFVGIFLLLLSLSSSALRRRVRGPDEQLVLPHPQQDQAALIGAHHSRSFGRQEREGLGARVPVVVVGPHADQRDRRAG